jgi:hypothetical protein
MCLQTAVLIDTHMIIPLILTAIPFHHTNFFFIYNILINVILFSQNHPATYMSARIISSSIVSKTREARTNLQTYSAETRLQAGCPQTDMKECVQCACVTSHFAYFLFPFSREHYLKQISLQYLSFMCNYIRNFISQN